MNHWINVFDVIPPNQRAVVVFSRESKFELYSKGSGETGNWKVDPERLNKIEKVIVYLRKPNESGGRIFVGNYTGYVPSVETRKTHLIRKARHSARLK